MKVCISSGHGKYIRGASGSPIPPCMDEVDEARKITDETAARLRMLGIDTEVFHDNTSHDQSTNLSTIVNWHNSRGDHDYDLSVHLNCYNGTAHGCEVLYVSSEGEKLATRIVDAICTVSGLTNRGAKYRSDLKFLNSTREVSALLEVVFCDNPSDCNILRSRFIDICSAIASAVADEDVAPGPGPEPPDAGVLFSASGTCSWFGGPADTGVSASEGLAFIYDYDEAPYLFLPQQPQGTSGLARRLDPGVFYIACRWDYDVTPKTMLRDSGQMALVTAKETGISRLAHPADWGPHEEQTGRAADLSPGLMDNLGLDTDDEVTVVYPYTTPA